MEHSKVFSHLHISHITQKLPLQQTTQSLNISKLNRKSNNKTNERTKITNNWFGCMLCLSAFGQRAESHYLCCSPQSVLFDVIWPHQQVIVITVIKDNLRIYTHTNAYIVSTIVVIVCMHFKFESTRIRLDGRLHNRDCSFGRLQPNQAEQFNYFPKKHHTINASLTSRRS